MIGTVQELGARKNGKPKVKIDGIWYFAGRCDISTVKPGNVLDFTFSEFGEPRNGKRMRGLDNWAFTSQASIPHAAEVQDKRGEPASSNYIDEAELRFISNVVGSDISAKTILVGPEVTGWALAAQEALRALKGEPIRAVSYEDSENPAPPDFDDKVPF